MKNLIKNKTKKYLESISICTKCNTKMKAVDVPLEALDKNTQNLIKGLGARHQAVTCRLCGSFGIHLI